LSRSDRPLIVDANVLIDYLDTEPSVLALVARETGPLFVAMEVLAKVDQLDVTVCEELGLTIAVPSISQLLEAAVRRPGLAFDDVVCLVMARDHGWCCVTNARALRAACRLSGVRVQWGLEIMLRLVARSALSSRDAIEVALAIQRSNRAFITDAIVDRFKIKAKQVAGTISRQDGV
jgi:predicted nucleic acid-binding protein